MDSTSGSSLSKIVKLNASNYHEWKRDVQMVLTLKDLWSTMNADRPPAINELGLREWKRVQEHSLAIIHLSCDKDQAQLCSHAATGIEA